MPKDHANGLDCESVDELAQRAIQDINPDNVDSSVLRRLLQDIRGEEEGIGQAISAYNRMHNRHNRGR